MRSSITLVTACLVTAVAVNIMQDRAGSGAGGGPCALHLVVAQHEENISWTRQLRLAARCVFIYRASSSVPPTALSLRSDAVGAAFIVPNTGREALSYLTHLRRIFTGNIIPAPITAFVQGLPHCSWNSRGDPNCVRYLADELQRISRTPEKIDAHGGAVFLSSQWPREFNVGLPLTNAKVRSCYLSAWQGMSGWPAVDAEKLFAAWEARAMYVPGAQFVLTRSLLSRRGGTLQRWLTQADAQMHRQGLQDSAMSTYSGDNCCGERRTCLPWLLERLWVSLFLLPTQIKSATTSTAGSGRDSLGDDVEPAMWSDPAALATLVLQNTSRHGNRFLIQLPVSIELRWLERHYAELARTSRIAEEMLPTITDSRLERLVRLYAPTRFGDPPERELYRRTSSSLEDISQVLYTRSHAAETSALPSSVAQKSAQERLRVVGWAAKEVLRCAHGLDSAGRAALMRLAYPLPSKTTVSSQATPPSVPPDWAASMCEAVRLHSGGCVCAAQDPASAMEHITFS